MRNTTKMDIAIDILDYLLDSGYVTMESAYNSYDEVKTATVELIASRLKDYIIVQGIEVE